MNLWKPAVMLAGLCLGGAGIATAAEEPCVTSEAASPPAIMAARGEMLAGRYDAFIDVSDPDDRMSETEKLNVANVLKVNYPDGFSRCEVLVLRQTSAKVTQEVSVFEAPGKHLLFVYFLVARIGGDETILAYYFSQNPSDQFGRLR